MKVSSCQIVSSRLVVLERVLAMDWWRNAMDWWRNDADEISPIEVFKESSFEHQ